MRLILRFGLVLLLTAPALLAQPPQPEPATPTRPLAEHPRVAETLRLLGTWLDAQRAYGQVPGSLRRGGPWRRAAVERRLRLADREAGEPATAETVYSICSISKVFTALAVMQLRDDGKLALADPVGEHLPWLSIEQAYPDGPPVTVWGLLTHSAGLPRESDYPYWTAPTFTFPTREEIRERLAEQETLYPAATYFQYSNLGLTLAGEVVAAVSGRPYAEYVQEELLAPMGLADTRTEMPLPEDEPRLAAGYGATTRGGQRDRLAPFTAGGIAPAAGYASTALDLARFAGWQLALLESQGQEGGDVLDVDTLREMQRVQWLDPDWETARGLGFGVVRAGDTTYVGHGGHCPGYRSTVWIDPKNDLGAAVLVNASSVGTELFVRRALAMLAPAVAEAKKAGPAEEAASAPDLERFAGTYSIQPWGGEVAVLPWKDGLAAVALPTEDPLEAMDELRHVEGNRFRRVRDDGELGEEVLFEQDDRGEIVAFVQHSNRFPRVTVE
jgi:CubicO group peptidase (beta-lactamase class C family)